MNNTVHSSTATSPQSPPPQLAAARPSLTIDIHAAQNKDFTLDQNDHDSPQSASFQQIALTPDSDDDDDQ